MNNLKTLTLTLAFTVAVTCATAGEPLRYFGQSETAYHSLTPYGNNEKTGAYATASDGAKIYFERYGTGAPVVVLHGGLVGSTAEMAEFIDHLRQTHEVIAISTRGHGKSEVGTATPTYAQKAADVLTVLKTAQIDGRADLLGFSDGGYTALAFAAAYPDRAAKIVAIGAGEWKFRAAAANAPRSPTSKKPTLPIGKTSKPSAPYRNKPPPGLITRKEATTTPK